MRGCINTSTFSLSVGSLSSRRQLKSCLAQSHFGDLVVLCWLQQYMIYIRNYGCQHQLARKMRLKPDTLWSAVSAIIMGVFTFWDIVTPYNSSCLPFDLIWMIDFFFFLVKQNPNLLLKNHVFLGMSQKWWRWMDSVIYSLQFLQPYENTSVVFYVWCNLSFCRSAWVMN